MIRQIYAIELSGVCNMACVYCPYHRHQRSRGFMDWRTLNQTVQWIKKGKLSAHEPLFLNVFGEPLLHPEFCTMAERLKKEVCPSISFSTNGSKLTPQMADRLAAIGFDWITVSPHAPLVANWAADLLRIRGVHVEMHKGPDHNWAGQVDHKTMWAAPCEFETDEAVAIHWDGDVMPCCIVDSKAGRIGTVWDKDLPERENRPFELCGTCHLKRKGNVDAQTVPVRQEGMPGQQEGLCDVG